jgi:glycosyltransferase involved in cell wall biosynthesis
MSTRDPLVSVVTPVYNGEKYLAECLESVLRQTYENWEYAVVDNASTDRTREIAELYARKDGRLKVYHYDEFVKVIQSHNRALRHTSPESTYCKIVSADDWLYPDCLRQMVRLAEIYPSVAIVGSYAINRRRISYVGLPPERSFFKGEDICRRHLLGGPLVVGVPTAVLYRSRIVRSEEPFFPGSAPSADISACYRTLQRHDCGFVHQILSYERIHDEALNAGQRRLNAFVLDRVSFLVDFGRSFLTREEYDIRHRELLDEYYRHVLAPAFIKRFPKNFWTYHKGRLQEIGLKFERARLVRAVLLKVLDAVGNPKRTLEKMLTWQR